MRRSCWAHLTTPPPCRLKNPAQPARAWTANCCASCLKLWRSWVWSGLRLRSPPAAAWMSGSCRGTVKSIDNELHHSSQSSRTRSPDLGTPPTPPLACSSAASSHAKMVPTQQPAKPETRYRSRSARRYPFPKRQGPRTKIALDPAPQASSWSAGQEEEGAKSSHSRTTPQAASFQFRVPTAMCLW